MLGSARNANTSFNVDTSFFVMEVSITQQAHNTVFWFFNFLQAMRTFWDTFMTQPPSNIDTIFVAIGLCTLLAVNQVCWFKCNTAPITIWIAKTTFQKGIFSEAPFMKSTATFVALTVPL